MKIVIRAGGGGTRLWPLSRKSKPKQFKKILNEKTLLQNTFERVKDAIKAENDLFVSVNESHKQEIIDELPSILPRQIIVEPAKRDTGPALCLEAAIIEFQVSDDPVIATLPSDDYINSAAAFVELMQQIEVFLNDNPEYIVTPGITPDTVDVGYSYIKTGKKFSDLTDYIFSYEVDDWVEKPDYERCKQLIDSGEYFYHTGMYFWKLSTVISLFEKYQPEMLKKCREFVKLSNEGKQEEAVEVFKSIEPVSIETAITKNTNKIAMVVSAKVKWSDVGKWYILGKLLNQDSKGNVVRGEHLGFETSNCVIVNDNPGKLITTLDVDNLAIIDSGNALFISNLQRSGEVKDIVKKLEEEDKEQYL
jgi:mannose-1-phosphate guanylyltransferase